MAQQKINRLHNHQHSVDNWSSRGQTWAHKVLLYNPFSNEKQPCLNLHLWDPSTSTLDFQRLAYRVQVGMDEPQGKGGGKEEWVGIKALWNCIISTCSACLKKIHCDKRSCMQERYMHNRISVFQSECDWAARQWEYVCWFYPCRKFKFCAKSSHTHYEFCMYSLYCWIGEAYLLVKRTSLQLRLTSFVSYSPYD